MKTAKRATSKPAQGWRENLEALIMAVVVALLFKYFILEISKIPSGSMQPTLMGNPETGVFDRTVVDKLSFRFRDPKRFEIVVFKHPLERSRIMVKRLVGMPEEELKIEYGDLWTRKGENDEWRILRRPPQVQREMWRALDAYPPRGPAWSTVLGGQDWHVTEDAIVARGDGEARFRTSAGPVRDVYQDGYPKAVAGRIPTPPQVTENNPVGDLRLEGELSALAGTDELRFALTEGQRVYEFHLPGPAAAADAAVRVRIRDSALSSERTETGRAFHLAPESRVSFAIENLDDRLALEIDGETLLEAEIEPSKRQEASLTIAVSGAGADLSDLRVFRDVYYLTPEDRASWTVQIPAGNYVMLGDNTQDSADGRLWKAISYTVPEGDRSATYRGNYRGGNENPTPGRLADGRSGIRFRDDSGEIHWIPSDPRPAQSLPGNEPLVPRELILGRAMAVFWPIHPFDGLWRIAWLH